jgi:hypothetical protein
VVVAGVYNLKFSERGYSFSIYEEFNSSISNRCPLMACTKIPHTVNMIPRRPPMMEKTSGRVCFYLVKLKV